MSALTLLDGQHFFDSKHQRGRKPNYKNVYSGEAETDDSHLYKLLFIVPKFAITSPVTILVESNLAREEK